MTAPFYRLRAMWPQGERWPVTTYSAESLHQASVAAAVLRSRGALSVSVALVVPSNSHTFRSFT